jgi:hypothetical protein
MNISVSPKLVVLFFCVVLVVFPTEGFAKRRAPAGGRLAVVVDERLSAVRTTPELSGKLIRRMGRGSFLAVRNERRSRDNVNFYRVNINSKTSGWIQREALVSQTHAGDDSRLLRLIKASSDFDRVARARIFLDVFSSSAYRPAVLLIYCQTAEEIAARLSREATRRLDAAEMTANDAPLFSYLLNYNGLDRYNRQGMTFIYDSREKVFRYDGEGWQELVHRYPRTPEAAEARKRLESRALTSPR